MVRGEGTLGRGLAALEPQVELGGRVLFDYVNLDLAAGLRLGVVGRNGIGKSTLLRIMIGELAPTRGKVASPRSPPTSSTATIRPSGR